MRAFIKEKQLDEERALYHLKNTDVIDCIFAGPTDGESALKEARDVTIENCTFSLRYPLWHVRKFTMKNTTMDELTRAAIWYAEDALIEHSTMGGIKAVRECKNMIIKDCKIDSQEFGWKSEGIEMENTEIISEYLFLDSKNVSLKNVTMKGKYSFQYMENLEIENCELDTKDAFWHSKNVTVRNSIIKGEYLGWFSEGLTFIDCKIIGTQPLCYCKNLNLIHCTMEDTNLSFEYSEVTADIKGHIISIKNPKEGVIIVDTVGEIIKEDPVMPCNGKVLLRSELKDVDNK